MFLFCSSLRSNKMQVLNSVPSGYWGALQMIAKPDLTKMEFGVWTDSVDQLFRMDYAVSIEDIGADRSMLHQVWEAGESPAGYVQWFGQKYDLTRRSN